MPNTSLGQSTGLPPVQSVHTNTRVSQPQGHSVQAERQPAMPRPSKSTGSLHPSLHWLQGDEGEKKRDSGNW